jgi:suppressor for copper-sensitivity B
MWLRSIPSVLAVLLACACHVAAAEKPYRVSLIGDAYAGDGWMTGVRVELADGWKTYWRMPGDAGIPPQFTWKTSAPVEVTVLYPLPGRFIDQGGETVGYKHEVVFPVTAKTAGLGVTLDLDLFFAVCREVCIPAEAEASIELGTAARDPDGSRRVEQWLSQVPLPGTPVTTASVGIADGKPALDLVLADPADDIFVEMDGSPYFGKPAFSADGRTARIAIDNIKDAGELKGTTLKLTVSRQGRGLEQQITLP